MSETKQVRSAASPKATKDKLENAVPISPEERAEAERIFAEAKIKLAIDASVITTILVSLCHVVFTKSEELPTMAVTITGDGNPLLMMNVDYLIKLGPEGAFFVLTHEVYHLLLNHLRVSATRATDDVWTMATESWINNRVMIHLNRNLPMIDGEQQGVNPEKTYDAYRRGAKAAGIEPVAKDTFYSTDETVYGELQRLPKPPKSRSPHICVRGAGEDENTGDGGNSVAPLDQEQLDHLVEKVLQGSLQAAKNGRPGAKEELLALMDATPDSKTWGDLGAGALRGETTVSRKTDLWAHWVRHTIGSKIAEGDRLRYNKKVPWFPRISPIGPGEKKHGSVYVDASGSMHPDVLRQVADLIGDDDEMEIEWHSFDGVVMPFEPGQPILGGGGTSFQIIEEHVAEKEEDQDFVLVITDGYAPHITPRDPNIWVWLIVPDGDPWPAEAGMSCRQIDLTNPS